MTCLCDYSSVRRVRCNDSDTDKEGSHAIIRKKNYIRHNNRLQKKGNSYSHAVIMPDLRFDGLFNVR